jgi:hypothetical protein
VQEALLTGRNVPLPVLGFRRSKARKIAKLARAFAALDDQARLVRPVRKRDGRLSLGIEVGRTT